jgi:DNA-binding transcriptional LysR family regulator
VFELFEGTEQEVANKLEGGNIDMALTILREGEAKEGDQVLYEEGYNLVISLDHPLAQKKDISATDLAEENMIVRSRCEVLSETSRYFTDHNVRPRLIYRTEQDERALQMVGTGMGVTVMPSTYKDKNIKRKNLRGFNLSRVIGLRKSPQGVLKGNEEVATLFEAFTTSHDWN